MVYKLVEIKGSPKIKLSDEFAKNTLPGPKSVLRIYENNETKPSFDVICLHGEEEELSVADDGQKELTVWAPLTKNSHVVKPSRVEVLS